MDLNKHCKALLTFLAIFLLLLSTFENCSAQESSKTSWTKIIKLHFGYPAGSNNWEYSHPLYNGTGGVQNPRETGSFDSESIFSCQFELSKGYFGFSAGVGTFPAEIRVDRSEENYRLNSFFLEIEGEIFPLKNPTAKLLPLINIGAGYVISSGDSDNSAHFISFGGGLRTFFTKCFGVALMLKGRYFTYNEITLTEGLQEDVSGDISFTNIAIQLGAMYSFYR